jgi:hypothetical protein
LNGALRAMAAVIVLRGRERRRRKERKRRAEDERKFGHEILR